MGWIDRIAGRLGFQKTATIQNPAAWLGAYARAEESFAPDPYLYGNEAYLYRKLSWLAVAVQTLAQSCATVKFSVERYEVDPATGTLGDVDIPHHPFEELLRKPNPLQSRSEFLEAWFSYRILTGNGLVWLNRADEESEPVEMWVIPSDMIRPVPDGKMFIKGYIFTSQYGQEIPLQPWEVMHWKRFNPASMYWGLSAVDAIATAAHTDLAKSERDLRSNKVENGRMPGILAFADSFTDPDWEDLQHQIDDKANKMRQFMLLRNVKAGGIQWIQTALAARDMQQVESRNLTQKEIYDTIAPGLLSMLSESATEANAKSGKATFSEYAMWPLLESAGQKITNDVLPAYGEKLQGEFDDVRVKDKALELQEQQEYSRTHTIDEVRKEFYSEGPIGDERGKLLIAEVKSSSPTSPIKPGTSGTSPNPSGMMTSGVQSPAGDRTKPQDEPQDEQDLEPVDPGQQVKAEVVHNGVMVALSLPETVAKQITSQKITFPKGSQILPPSEMHITLAYLGDIEELIISQEELLQAVGLFADSYNGSIDGSINGMGKFFTSHIEGMGVIYLNFDAPNLPELRQRLLKVLEQAGMPIIENHGFTPHITLAYIPSEAAMPEANLGEIPVHINAVTVAWGDQVSNIRFGQNQAQSEMKRFERKALKRLKEGKNAACEFESEVLRAGQVAAIQGALEGAKTVERVKAIFVDARRWESYP